VRVDTAAPRTTTLPTVAAQYETLRSAALGAPLPPEARHGLLLFLGRGMWAWTQAVATATAILPPSTRATAAAPSPHERGGIIHVFAAMARSSPPRRAR
jgi:hypothetical protein